MKIKSVVKVMNFHALLRVDKSRKTAEMYREMEEQLTIMMNLILNNKNFILDKKINVPDSSKPPLRIYIGSDLGFCGSVNSSVSRKLKSDNGVKVVIGKKTGARASGDTILKFNREDFEEYDKQLSSLLKDAIQNRQYSSITIIYNHYYNVSKIEITEKQIYPLNIEFAQDKTKQNDYILESIDGDILLNMILQYLIYEVRIAWLNSYASENVLRQSTTSESLKKIDAIEEDEEKALRKEKKMKSFKKVLDTYVNQKATKEDEEE